MLIPFTRPPGARLKTHLVTCAFGLAEREAQLPVLLAQGMSPVEAAGYLKVQVGTIRNHLKSIFEKSGTRRQGELVALLSRPNV